ncbi:MAG: LamG-like jellyroll fold domain-containing protein, partial [Myxococcota bacterium]
DGCSNEITPGAPCDDNDPTTRDDACNVEGQCGGFPIVCDEGPCVLDAAPNGTDCDLTYKPQGAYCDDEDPQTKDDLCDGADGCKGSPYSCELAPCEITSTPNGVGCDVAYWAAETACDDADPTTKDDLCDGQGGCIGTPYACEPTQCQAESAPNGTGCDVTDKLEGTACDDQDPGTKADQCDGQGACTGTPYTCEPGPCVDSAAPNGAGCDLVFTAEGTGCDDADLSTKDDQCDGQGACLGTAFTCQPTQCEGSSVADGQGCAVEYWAEGTECDDDDLTTKDDQCDGEGGCVGTVIECEPTQCQVSSEPDGEGCVVIDKMAGIACHDGDVTTKSDACDGQGGCVGTPYTCEPTQCEATSTPNGSGCDVDYWADGKDCDDQDPGTTDDQCDGQGGCMGTPYTCPVGLCELTSTPNGQGCDVSYALEGAACDDQDSGTLGDQCDGQGGCEGTPYTCPVGQCDVSAAPNGTDCDTSHKASGVACDDSDPETKDDQCDGNGECVGTPYGCVPSQCEASSEPDGDNCLVTYASVEAGCDDSDPTTLDDHCDGAGGCVGTPYGCTPSQCESTSTPNGEDCTVEYAAAATPCDDEDPSTKDDQCDGFGLCGGEGYTCPVGVCQLSSSPNGVDCTPVYAGTDVACNDDDAATVDDHCDGQGGCVGVDPVCGDGDTEGLEACDDGDTEVATCAYGEASCLVCSETCTLIEGEILGYCGDDIIQGAYGEACDDGGVETGDGCDAECAYEPGVEQCQSLHFDGVDDYAVMDSPGDAAFTSVTAAVWIYPTAAPGGAPQSILVKHSAQWGGHNAYSLELQGDGTVKARLQTADCGGPACDADPDVNFLELYAPSGTVATETWSHLALTFDEASLSGVLYVNGQALASGVEPSGLFYTDPDAPLHLGGNYVDGALSYPFMGQLHAAQIFDEALTSAEVLDLFKASSLAETDASLMWPTPEPMTGLTLMGADNEVCSPGCGDDMRAPWEGCDDGGNQDDDGCSAVCTVEPCVAGQDPTGLGNTSVPGQPAGVDVVGQMAYLASQSGGLQIVDVSDPGSPSIVGSLSMSGSPRSVHVVGETAYVAAHSGGLRIVDVSDPQNPVAIGHYATPIYTVDVHVVGDVAYLAEWEHGLTALDVSDPSTPVVLGHIDVGPIQNGVFAVGTTVYTSDYYNGMRVFDASDPSALSQIGFYDNTDGLYEDIHVVDDVAYLADWNNGLRLIDVSEPQTPVEHATLSIDGSTTDVRVIGSQAYVTSWSGGLHIVDVSDSEAPSVSHHITTQGDARGVDVLGGKVYVADNSAGLHITDLNLPCEAGEVCILGDCVACEPGGAPDPLGTSCEPCPEGTYGPDGLVCLPCEVCSQGQALIGCGVDGPGECVVTSLGADCAEVHANDPSLPSGHYGVDPDGEGGDAPFIVYCDMETDGGGWTRLFVAETGNYNATNIDYTVTSMALRQAADEAMIAYVDAEDVVIDSQARFPMPEAWVVKSPMQYSAEDLAVQATVGGVAVGQRTLRFGTCDHEGPCCGGWGSCSSSWLHGRVCLCDTTAPYWGFWAGPNASYQDACGTSEVNVGGGSCSESRRFSILVRRSVCGNGIIEQGEGCESDTGGLGCDPETCQLVTPAGCQAYANGNQGYYICKDELKNWGQTRARCESYNAKMLSIDDAAERDWIYTQTSPTVHGYWSDGTDENHEGTWKTGEGANLSYLPWCASEPNSGTIENCLQMYWSGQNCSNDSACHNGHHAACEFTLSACDPSEGPCDDPAPPSTCDEVQSPCGTDSDCCSGHCYADADQDGARDSSGATHCQPEASIGDDCCATDDEAYPGQAAFFTEQNACGDYDYDCSGDVTYSDGVMTGEMFHNGSSYVGGVIRDLGATCNLGMQITAGLGSCGAYTCDGDAVTPEDCGTQGQGGAGGGWTCRTGCKAASDDVGEVGGAIQCWSWEPDEEGPGGMCTPMTCNQNLTTSFKTLRCR